MKVDLKSCDCYDYDCWYSASKCWDRRSMNESTTTTNFTVVVNGSVTVKVDCLQADCSIYDYWYYCEDCWNKGLNATTEVAVKAARNTSMRFGKELKSSVNRDYCIDYCWWCESWDCWFWCGWCFKNGTDSTTLSTEQRFAKTVTNSSDPGKSLNYLLPLFFVKFIFIIAAVRVVCTKCDCATYDCWWYCTECQGMNSTSPPEAKSANTTGMSLLQLISFMQCSFLYWCSSSSCER